MKEMQYNSGEIIIKEGTIGDSAFILKQGSVEVRKKTKVEDLLLATLVAQEIFGEMGLIEDKPRSATVIAKSPVIVDEISREDFMGLLDDKKSFIIPILRAFFERLRQTNDLVVQLENKIGISGTAAEDTSVKVVRISGMTDKAIEILNNKELIIKKFPFKIGRESAHRYDAIFVDNDMFIEDEMPYNVSKNHLSINLHGNQFYVLDRGSSLGTIVNGKNIGGNISDYKAVLNKGKNTMIIGSETSPYQFKITL
ncbi:MAG: cyclic nucleotide-binding domain-containing protein [Candidatus Marinimicrobia bacterium]|nr:cyclic nucleotide-binding domain-containing protein [Candidatus Neomarinimicrobiota bacterium]